MQKVRVIKLRYALSQGNLFPVETEAVQYHFTRRTRFVNGLCKWQPQKPFGVLSSARIGHLPFT